MGTLTDLRSLVSQIAGAFLCLAHRFWGLLQVDVVIELMSLECLDGAGIPRSTSPELCSTITPPHDHHTLTDLRSLFYRLWVLFCALHIASGDCCRWMW